ncbi:MAG: PCMD domain-containing protein, partial [Alistipes sp.]
ADVGTSKSFTTTTDQTIADGSMESSALSCFTTDNGASKFWSSGNNSFADYLCKQSTYTGMSDAHTAKLSSGAPVGILAAGNLFTGLFYKDGMSTGVVEFGQPYTWKARPTALKVKYYAEKIGKVDVNKHSGAPITMGDQDKARIFVAIVDWSKRRKVASGTSAPTGIWDPENGMNSVPEGKIIGYGSLFIDQSSTGGTMIDVEIPIHFYDKTARPSGTYSLVISSSASAYGDYMVGCKSNVMHVDDFRWEY